MPGIGELEELTLFLQEKAREFDPTIDTSTGSNFHSTVIKPLIERLSPDPYDTPIRPFILGRLSKEFPDLVLQDGEPLDDYAVKIMQILLSPFRRQIQQISNNQSLADPSELNEREADKLGGNFFVRRKLGGFSVGVARVYFSAPQGVQVTPNNAVYDAAGHRFYPVENQAISSSNMLFNVEGNLYFFDIVCRAEKEGKEYDIEKNTLIGIEELPSAVKVTNKAKFEEGQDKESTGQYVERIENSLTERSLVTFRGINARLTDVFENIRLIQVIGHGDPEMNRDILTAEAEPPVAYAYFMATASALGDSRIDLSGQVLLSDGTQYSSFITSGVQVGDLITWADIAGGVVSKHVVTEVNASYIEISPGAPHLNAGYTISHAKTAVTISDIPGGILQPTTAAGEIVIREDELHLGGALDVFVRAGAPLERDTILEGALDGSPLHFGVDLESFGSRPDEIVHLTPELENIALRPSLDRFAVAPVTDEILVQQYDAGAGVSPWKPTEEDVGRYVQILSGGDQALLEILEIVGEEYKSGIRTVRIKVSTTNEEDPSTPYTLGSNDAAFDTSLRLVEKIGTQNRVRDRDGSRTIHTSVPTGTSFGAEGVSVGDSVVVETGDDAGIYSVRRILDWMGTKDTLVLDRDLTKTVTPAGTGDGSGLRYRIADELNVDLVDPKVTKIPLGTVFTGDDLSTVSGSPSVSVLGSTNFLLAGVEPGDTLEILEGDNKGQYTIQSVQGTTAELDAGPPNTQASQRFSVYKEFSGVERPLVRVKEIELLDSNSQPTGITIPYGYEVDARALGIFSNRAEGVQQESYTGEIDLLAMGSTVLKDDNVDFEAEGVVPGYRLNVLNTKNSGRYVISKVGVGDGLPSDNHIEVTSVAEGGVEFETTSAAVHYTVGMPSSGVVRVFFQEPTSVEVLTGLTGGRLSYEEEGTSKSFFFSEVSGYPILPAEGSGDDRLRDIRTVRSYSVLADYQSILELTDPNLDVFGLEIQEGDIVEVNEQIPFRRTAGETFAELGVFGKPAGLRTVSGSNRVTVPSNSLIDFSAMNSSYTLVGQKLFIDEGPDAGEYVIEEVVDSKTLRLNKVLTSSTEGIVHQETGGLRDATLTPGVSSTTLADPTDVPGTEVGNYITIFESTRGDIDGAYEVLSIIGGGSAEIDMDPGTYESLGAVIDPFGVGAFSWVNTVENTNVGHAFRIYKSVAKQAEVVQVATKRVDIDLEGLGDTPSLTTLTDSSAPFGSVEPGDRLEIVSGPNAGVYPIESVDSTSQITIVDNPSNKFSVTGTETALYRIWGGLHGSTKLLTVGPFESDDGLIEPGEMMPFRIIRPKVFRISSTDMSENFDGSFYYFDIQVESLGSGDEFNLDRNDRMVVKSGLSADGYTYSVENNNLTFSPFEKVHLNFDRRFLPVGNSDSPENMTEVSGRNLKIVYETSTTAKLVHDLMRSDTERPINANPLGRHFLPSYVHCQLTYRGGSSADEVGRAIEDYINHLGAEDEIEISDLEAFITRRGATSIDHPILLAVLTHDLDRKLVVNRTENRLGGLLTVPYNGTGRISSFFATLGEGLKVEKQS